MALKPILKWTGGKRQLVKKLINYVPQDINKYYEPFIGGGALYFALNHNKSIINDFNYELVNFYNVIKSEADNLELEMADGDYSNNKENFLRIRSLDRSGEGLDSLSNIQRAARFYYLNRTSYSGIYRVNSQGQYNTPFGNYSKPKYIFAKLGLHKQLLNNTVIRNENFSDSISDAEKNDFVYFDPPYAKFNDSEMFTSYTQNGFDWDEQLAVLNCMVELTNKGVYVLGSNSNSELLIKEIEKRGLFYETVSVIRSINSDTSARGNEKEIIIYNSLVDTYKKQESELRRKISYLKIPQANNVDVMMKLLDNSREWVAVTDAFKGIKTGKGASFTPRQHDYYIDALNYLGCIDIGESSKVKMFRVKKHFHKEVTSKNIIIDSISKNLWIKKLMLKTKRSGKEKSKNEIEKFVSVFDEGISEAVAKRRASTMHSWIEWYKEQ